jgi:CubicO group peptidase (beta-lactamase class C family)
VKNMTSLTKNVAQTVAAQMNAGAISGGVVFIARDGKTEVLSAQGVADFDPSFPLHTDTIFGVMSMTKPVTAACAAILIAEGRLGTGDPISRYIPEFAKSRQVRTLRPGESYPPFPPVQGEPLHEPRYNYEPAARELFVHDLLNFTSGLQTIGVPNAAIPPVSPDDSLASWVAKLGDAPLEFQPGTAWHYSNATSYEVLGRIIEVASGQSFDDFAKERLFDPLGMEETRFGIDPAVEHRVAPLGFLRGEHVTRIDFPSGSAGLFSTALDYARFAQMLLNGGTLDGRVVMPAEAVAMMCRNQIGNLPFSGTRVSEYAWPIQDGQSAFRYGYGVGIVAPGQSEPGLPAGSFGWDGIGSRRFWVIPQTRTVLIMLMPGMGPGAEPAHRAIEALVGSAAS